MTPQKTRKLFLAERFPTTSIISSYNAVHDNIRGEIDHCFLLFSCLHVDEVQQVKYENHYLEDGTSVQDIIVLYDNTNIIVFIMKKKVNDNIICHKLSKTLFKIIEFFILKKSLSLLGEHISNWVLCGS